MSRYLRTYVCVYVQIGTCRIADIFLPVALYVQRSKNAAIVSGPSTPVAEATLSVGS